MKWKWGGTEACKIRQFVKANTGPPGPAPRALSANRSAPGRPAGPGTRGGEGTALHPRPAALPARRTCRRWLPPPPPAEPGRGGGGGGRAPAGTAADFWAIVTSTERPSLTTLPKMAPIPLCTGSNSVTTTKLPCSHGWQGARLEFEPTPV
ncbi:SH3-containing GRB2-like protein 3-interacting protein 1 isoform X1 [Canis lupus familiaris]|uniref:SH3-containing GRB2-like protein 3-interacting protein 1 n=1 Tax=Canis lupus dingo TaxID=286419 RepID=UPI0006B3CF31|nr:SH3-containing GRB2-like protein 3-interacting protein 1 [Canis lupus dingo]XP_038405421.1 SH3-containing GRB2-like protein 3-interacting protein 1 isoform X1 [Canis lupus familiaris]XP_038478140.1 SH3-containing GRB2-like protein 3-interacting protein 1 isoform X1 [Canis lupus familiaris]XP_038531034.1 SH3-containing GRB2-like protein 3-interacting protein 1 isoform X1 [Canis lupus familiaris]